MPASTATLPLSRPSLLDGLAHAALARACAAFRQADAAGQGLPPLLVDATLGNGARCRLPFVLCAAGGAPAGGGHPA